MADKEKNAREFDFEVEQKGKNVKRAFKLTEVSLNQQNEATKVYNRAFRDALESGALLRNKLEDNSTQIVFVDNRPNFGFGGFGFGFGNTFGYGNAFNFGGFPSRHRRARPHRREA